MMISQEAVAVLNSLLKYIYRSFDFREEEDVYDKLTTSVHGNLLSDIYLQNRKCLLVTQTGGVRAAGKGVTADLVSFSRAQGAYAGLSLDGSVVKVNDDFNKDYYGKAVRPTDILVKKDVSNAGSAKLREALANAEKGR